MKTINEIKQYLESPTNYFSNNAKKYIRYWLMGKGLIGKDDDLVFSDGAQAKSTLTFEDFLDWYENSNVTHIDARDIFVFQNSVIRGGDFVKVHSIDNPRNEYVESMGMRLDKLQLVYLLSDGTWVTESGISKYKVQGAERMRLIDKLNEIYND